MVKRTIIKNHLLPIFIILNITISSIFAAAPWSEMKAVTNNDVMDQFPSIDIMPGDIPVIACNEIIPGKKYDIMLFKSLPPNTVTENVTNTPLVSDYQPVVKCDSKGRIHVLYLSRIAERNNKLYIFHTFYKNGHWSTATCISLAKEGKAPESRPAASIDSHDVLHVVFHDDDGKLYYSQCSEGIWNTPRIISGSQFKINWAPSLWIDSKQKLHLIYLAGEQGAYNLVYRMYDLKTWSIPEVVVDYKSHPWHPTCAVDFDGNIYIAYASDTPLMRNISLISGKPGNWSRVEYLIKNKGDFDNPCMITDKKGFIHLTFNGGMGGNNGEYEIYYSNNINGKFFSPVTLTNDNIFEYQPVMAMDSKGYGYLAYYGFDGYDTEIFYQKTKCPLHEITNPESSLTYSDFTLHKKRYLPPLDTNYIPDEATCLRDKKITISAGHGGLAHLAEYRWGATNTREDELNLQVALYLQDYLEKAGSMVYMCRTTDIDIGLDDRPGLANETNSDLFVSIHHNSFDFYSNYACVYFHGNPSDNPDSCDLSSLVSNRIAEYLNIPNKGSMSDYFSFWNSGYAELRGLKNRPGILGEGSHFYCFEEEEQLRNLDYLKREAYAYFTGIIRYYSQPKPSAVIIEPKELISSGIQEIKIQLDDGVKDSVYKIIPSSIKLTLDGKVANGEYDWKTGILTFKSELPLKEGRHYLTVLFETFDKVSSPLLEYQLDIRPDINL
jgi:N-acetylmuramoyl-L-alanine amidase